MVRAIPPDRLERSIQVAASTFIARGYRQTQMADVAAALGVAKGTLYGYVESKDALFDAAVRFADRLSELSHVAALPLETPAPGQTVAYVRQRLSAEASEMCLVRALQGALGIEEPAVELTAVLDDLYERLARNRYAIKLVDRCAMEYPELGEAWFGDGRWAQHELLTQLLRLRIADGRYRRVGAVPVAARTLLESVAFWAVHRHFDPAPQQVDEVEARRTAIDLLVRGVVEQRP